MTFISINHVTRVFGDGERQITALADVSAHIARGELVALMGPSGSGKTTLLNMISALDAPTSGDVVIDGVSCSTRTEQQRSEIRQRIGFIFQRFALIPTASAYENIEFSLRISQVPRHLWEERITNVLTQLEMNDHANKRPNELSGGQQQRIAIARALAIDPDFIIADEPTANLDSQRGTTVLELFRTLCQQGKTIIMSTHDPAAERYATHIYRMQAGHIVTIDTPTRGVTPTLQP